MWTQTVAIQTGRDAGNDPICDVEQLRGRFQQTRLDDTNRPVQHLLGLCTACRVDALFSPERYDHPSQSTNSGSRHSATSIQLYNNDPYYRRVCGLES